MTTEEIASRFLPAGPASRAVASHVDNSCPGRLSSIVVAAAGEPVPGRPAFCRSQYHLLLFRPEEGLGGPPTLPVYLNNIVVSDTYAEREEGEACPQPVGAYSTIGWGDEDTAVKMDVLEMLRRRRSEELDGYDAYVIVQDWRGRCEQNQQTEISCISASFVSQDRQEVVSFIVDTTTSPMTIISSERSDFEPQQPECHF